MGLLVSELERARRGALDQQIGPRREGGISSSAGNRVLYPVVLQCSPDIDRRLYPIRLRAISRRAWPSGGRRAARRTGSQRLCFERKLACCRTPAEWRPIAAGIGCDALDPP